MKNICWFLKHPGYATCWFITGNPWSHVFAK